MESDDTPVRDRDALAALEITRPALGPLLRLKPPEAFELDRFSGGQRGAHLLEQGVDHLPALALAGADVRREQVPQFVLGQRAARDALRAFERRAPGERGLPFTCRGTVVLRA